MARLAPKTDVVRALFARSGNKCAFPNCEHELINHRNQLVAQICHIEAASDGGERANLELPDEKRRDYDNLLLLCYAHHVETNDESVYTVEKMKAIKLDHEKRYQYSNFTVTEEVVLEAQRQSRYYWNSISQANTIEHSFEELKFEINASHTLEDSIANMRDKIAGLRPLLDEYRLSDERLPQDLEKLFVMLGLDAKSANSIAYYKNPFENRNWESHNLGTPNWSTEVLINMLEIEIKYYELNEVVFGLSTDQKTRLIKARKELLQMAKYALKVD